MTSIRLYVQASHRFFLDAPRLVQRCKPQLCNSRFFAARLCKQLLKIEERAAHRGSYLQAKANGDGSVGRAGGVVAFGGVAIVPLNLGALVVVGRSLDLETAEGAAVDQAQVVADLAVLAVKGKDERGDVGARGGAGNLVRVLLAVLGEAVAVDLAGREVVLGLAVGDEDVPLAVVVDGGGRVLDGDAGGAGEADDGEDGDLLEHFERIWWG